MIDIEKIKQAALAATEGRRSSFESLVYLPEQSGGFDICDAPQTFPCSRNLVFMRVSRWRVWRTPRKTCHTTP